MRATNLVIGTATYVQPDPNGNAPNTTSANGPDTTALVINATPTISPTTAT